MKNIRKHYGLAVIVIAAFLMWRSCAEKKQTDADKLLIDSLFSERDSLNGETKTLQLSLRQFSEYEKKLADSIESLGIKINRLERVTTVRVKTEVKEVPVVFRDTTIMWKDTGLVSGKITVVDSGCVSAVVFTPFDSDTSYVSQYCILNGLMAVHLGKRIRQHYLFGWKKAPVFRTGPRQKKASFITDCPGAEVYITDIEIKKE